MKKLKLVVIIEDSIDALLEKGQTYEFFEKYYNPDQLFDEVYVLSGYITRTEYVEGIRYVCAKPEEFYKHIQNIQPDIVRVYGGRIAVEWASASRIKNIPFVVSLHDTSPLYMAQSIRDMDYILCTSEAVKRLAKDRYGLKEKKFFVNPNGIDSKVFSRKEDSKVFKLFNTKYGKEKHILHVGRKSYEKNLETLIKSLEYLPGYCAVFLGIGDIEPYEKLAKEIGVESRCFLEQSAEKGWLPYYYSWCDCMCTPSRYEGFGNVFIEAALCEAMVVTSNVPAMNEYFKDGYDSYLVDEYENPKILADVIKKACDDNNENRIMKKNARKTGEQFEFKRMKKQEAQWYRRCIENFKNVDYQKKMEEDICKKVIIYGAGYNGRKLKSMLEEGKVAFFVDRNPEKIGTTIEDVLIISYEEMKEVYMDYTIVITPNDSLEIREQFKNDKIPYLGYDYYKILLKRMGG